MALDEVTKGQAQQEPRAPWDQQPGEPDKAYGRFQVYLGLGPTRTLSDAALAAGGRSRGGKYAFGGNWSRYCREWDWRNRARAWDVRERELVALSERSLRMAQHKRRVEMLDEDIDMARTGLHRARLEELSVEEAREQLPQLRQLYLGLLATEQKEFAGPEEHSECAPQLEITADDLAQAQRMLEERMKTDPKLAEAGAWMTQWRPGRDEIPAPPRPYHEPSPCRQGRTVSVLGSEELEQGPMLPLDFLRTLRETTGLTFHRLLRATKENVQQHFKREASFGRPVELLHLALPATPEGVQLADGPVNAEWLRARLAGVQVLVLAAYTGEAPPVWAQDVPQVVTIAADLDPTAAQEQVQTFWREQGERG
jgi:hypothetical protein